MSEIKKEEITELLKEMNIEIPDDELDNVSGGESPQDYYITDPAKAPLKPLYQSGQQCFWDFVNRVATIVTPFIYINTPPNNGWVYKVKYIREDGATADGIAVERTLKPI